MDVSNQEQCTMISIFKTWCKNTNKVTNVRTSVRKQDTLYSQLLFCNFGKIMPQKIKICVE